MATENAGCIGVAILFEDYLLDPDKRELALRGAPVATTPKVFDLLLYLIQHRDRVVSKAEVLEAVWAGRTVSESTLGSHINAVRKAIGDNGESQSLVRTVSRRGFRFIGEVIEAKPSLSEPVKATSPFIPLPDRPSIAVLRFQNLSGEPEQDYFTDGIVEDIITALSRIGWLFVIARNSSFSYAEKFPDVTQVGRDLGVRYVLEGSVRRSAGRVRISAQLIDATAGTYIWGERFESEVSDIFELQDQVTSRVVGSIAPQLERAEIERACLKPTDSLDAYDYYLRGMARFHHGSRDAINEAIPLFCKAIDLDPAFASAYGIAAWCYFWRKINGWSTGDAAERLEAARLAGRAIELGRNDAVALARGGHALGHFGGDLETCIALLDRSRELNANLSVAWYLSGFQRITRGNPDDAIEYFARAIRLSPLDPELLRMQVGMALAHLIAGRFDEASMWAERAFQELSGFLLAVGVIAASHALAGRAEDAGRAVAHLKSLDPALRISNLKSWVMLDPNGLEIFAKGLRMAGLPE